MSIQTKTYKSKKTNKNTTKYYAVVYDPNTKKKVWSKGFNTRSEAKEEELRLSNNVDIIKSYKSTFKEISCLWLESSNGVYANSTIKGYEWYLEKYILPVFGTVKITNISSKQLQLFVNKMLLQYSPETVNKTINILSNVVHHAMMLGLIVSDIMSNIKRKKVVKKEISIWSESQIKNFLEYDKVVSSDYYDMLLIIFSFGMRPSEVCGIKIEDISGNLLILNRGLDRYNEITNMKNQKSHRSIYVPETILSRLKTKIANRKEGFLFVNKLGNPVNPNSLSKVFKRLLNSYNLENMSLPNASLYEAARHSFGSNLVVNYEVPLSVVSSLMGNSERVLQSRYVHVKNDAKSVAIAKYVENIV